MKIICKLSILSLLLTLSSSAVAEVEPEAAIAPQDTRGVKVKSSGEAMTRLDTLRLIYDYQTSPRVLLNNHIVHKDGEYRLMIPKDRASSLGVSSETYDRYESYVEKLNEN